MTAASIAFDTRREAKIEHDVSVVPRAPSVLVQDPVKKRAYLISSEKISAYKAEPHDLAAIGTGTITFSIPDARTSALLQEVPAFDAAPGEQASILIQHPTHAISFLLRRDQLEEHQISYPVDSGVTYDVSFAMPVGTEGLERLPPLMKAVLQICEAGWP